MSGGRGKGEATVIFEIDMGSRLGIRTHRVFRPNLSPCEPH